MVINVSEAKKILGRLITNFIEGKTEPVTLTLSGEKSALLIPYSEEDEMFAEVHAGNTQYEDYRQMLLNKAAADLREGRVKVRPGDVITSERVEDEKKRTKLMVADFAFEAAKFFSLNALPHQCPECGHTMLPDGEKAKQIPEAIQEAIAKQG